MHSNGFISVAILSKVQDFVNLKMGVLTEKMGVPRDFLHNYPKNLFKQTDVHNVGLQ